MENRASVLSLYRSILKTHAKCLPPKMRQLGDTYVKSEFRLHKTTTKPEYLSEFFTSWRSYLEQIKFTSRAKDSAYTVGDSDVGSQTFSYGKPLPSNLKLNEDQEEQLEKLKEEATRSGGS